MENSISDQEKTYEVCRYFDDHLETIVKKGLSKTEARKEAERLNDTVTRSYVGYSIRESKT